MQFLLDTNTCIDVMRNHPNVVARMSAVAPGDCVISTITSYELYTGIAKCASPDKEQAKVDLLLKTVSDLSFGTCLTSCARVARSAAGHPALTPRTNKPLRISSIAG